nr:hypothetical protein [Actinomadura soli]
MGLFEKLKNRAHAESDESALTVAGVDQELVGRLVAQARERRWS